jgi:hypothetical protein
MKPKSLVIWLDSDKLANARKIASNASLLGFFPVHVLYTEKDPKAYTPEEIKKYLDLFKGE